MFGCKMVKKLLKQENKEMLNSTEIKQIEKKVQAMKLSEILARLQAIHATLRENGNEAIDEIIPLLEEKKILKARAGEMTGNIESYLSSEQN